MKPQAGQRQTACIRYIALPHRSQSVGSAARVWLGVALEAARDGSINGSMGGRTDGGEGRFVWDTRDYLIRGPSIGVDGSS